MALDPLSSLDRLPALLEASAAWLQAQLLDQSLHWQALGLLPIALGTWLTVRLLRPLIEVRVSRLRPDFVLARLAAFTLRLMPLIAFVLLEWMSIGMLGQLGLGEHTQLLEVLASLLSAWVLISLASSFIANRLLAKLVFSIIWLAAALNILGVLGAAIAVLDAVAIPFGASEVSLLTLMKGALLLIVLLWLAVALSGLLQERLSRLSDLSPRAQVLLGKAVRFLMIAVAVIVALSSVGTNFAALAVFTGALGVGIGIGLQQQVSNLLSGLFLLLDKSVKPGDVIEVGETFGWVKDMRARYVGVITRDNKELLIPNDDFVSNQVINWSHSDEDVRMEVAFGVAYDSDPHQIRELAVHAASAAARLAKSRQPVCHLVEFGDSALQFVLRFWINDPQEGVTNIKGQVLLKLWDLFQEHGVEIPYPHREVLLKNP